MPRESKPMDPIERVARSVELLVKLTLMEIKGDRTQREMIHLLGEFGLGGGEIAGLLNLSRTTVDPELSKLRAANKGGNAPQRLHKRKS